MKPQLHSCGFIVCGRQDLLWLGGHMGKRLNGWSLAGFLAVSVLGTLAHFCYEWSGEKLLVGAFCAVNESTW